MDDIIPPVEWISNKMKLKASFFFNNDFIFLRINFKNS